MIAVLKDNSSPLGLAYYHLVVVPYLLSCEMVVKTLRNLIMCLSAPRNNWSLILKYDCHGTADFIIVKVQAAQDTLCRKRNAFELTLLIIALLIIFSHRDSYMIN